MCIYANILDHHHVWRSLSPTLRIWSNLKGKKKDGFNSLFFIFLKRMPSFFFILKRDNYISQAHPQLSAQLST